MTFVVIARWTAKHGEEEAVAAALERLAPPSREESGCLTYLVNRSLSDPRVFLLFEEYADEDAYKTHAESDHFARFALGEGIPHLESREREFYAPYPSPRDDVTPSP
jgi:quinol monooxygenase YgiN